jgi:putative addiction module component (TIGR02574 family)
VDLRVIQGSKKARYNVLMNKDAREILQKALALSDNERAELAGNLIASLDTDLDPDADALWQAEVARRWDEVRSGRVKTISLDEVKRRARTLLHG